MKGKLNSYNHTISACFIGYVVQAIIVNFAPLLFLTFQNSYGIPLSQITMLVTVNFGVQLLVDLLSAGFVDKIGYRVSMLLAHLTSAGGLLLLAFLPDALSDPFLGLLIAVIVYAIGGGLLEVLVSPVMESCPTDNKEKAMSLLHSFYSWGQVGVVLLSTIYFSLFGTANWKILAVLWAAIPVFNFFVFLRVPIAPLIQEGERGLRLRELFSRRIFWLFFLMMLCAGAAEQTVTQWASAFAEQSLGVGKVLGDLLGPMTFALAMGAARLIFGLFGGKIKLNVFMTVSSALCAASYLCLSLTAAPAAGLAGCALCGFSVGIMWPGTYSKAASYIKGGGTTLFALLALGGDIGCTVGPGLAGAVSDMTGGNLKAGILAAAVFPAVMLVCCVIMCKMTGGKRDDSVGARAANEDNAA